MSASAKEQKILEELLATGCHFGHKVSKWNPKMRRFIYTKREGIHIFDLTKTYKKLQSALEFLQDCAANGKIILIVSTKLHTSRFVMEAAQACGCPYVIKKWIPGLLTNFDTLKKRIKYFKDLKEQKKTGGWDKYTKKERVELGRVLDKLDETLSGVEDMSKLPDAIVVLDSVRDKLVLKEARKLKITTIGVCDSNADPDMLTYAIPGNDDAIKSIKYFLEKISEAIREGKKSSTAKAPAVMPAKVEKKIISSADLPVV